MARNSQWYLRPQLGLEVFLWLNVAGLVPDIYLAHSMNHFRRPQEYLPLYFSLTAPLLLLIGLAAWQVWGRVTLWRVLGQLVGWTAIVIGVFGLIFHLESRFFQELTLASLVYSAPFAAPLAYTALGLMLLMNRLVDPDSEEWPRWVLLFALGGFAGNFVFSLADHASNGFFHATEWIPVVSSGLAVGFLLVPFLMAVGRRYLAICAAVMLLQGAVGVLGFCYHFSASWHGPANSLFGNLVSGAPVLAPLLFADVMLLALLGLWVLRQHVPAEIGERTERAVTAPSAH
ncbi:MAG TPA: hypothetical protein VH575_33660 [Gemmataceae bacterium]|jgi:hypothetical protein